MKPRGSVKSTVVDLNGPCIHSKFGRKRNNLKSMNEQRQLKFRSTDSVSVLTQQVLWRSHITMCSWLYSCSWIGFTLIGDTCICTIHCDLSNAATFIINWFAFLPIERRKEVNKHKTFDLILKKTPIHSKYKY